jgi:5-methylcytosine-specific restriction enzyme A
MSTKRAGSKVSLDKMPRGPGGRRLCRWCSTEVPRGRIAYCNNKCQMEVAIRSNPGQMRWHVKQRDKGVCAQCGFDAGKLKRILDRASYSIGHYWHVANGMRRFAPRWNWKEALLRQMGFSPNQALWEADHIVEVVDGGGECGLENIQTLCQICHKEKTALMRRERAKRRRDNARPLVTGDGTLAVERAERRAG